MLETVLCSLSAIIMLLLILFSTRFGKMMAGASRRAADRSRCKQSRKETRRAVG